MPSSPKDGGGYKMVLVLRGEIRLTAGKAAVQCAHAAVMLVLAAGRRHAGELETWLQEGQKKIAVVAPALGDLEELQRLAKGRGILTAMVEDAGLTEVAPGTRTCLGLGPARAEELDALTGRLPLL